MRRIWRSFLFCALLGSASAGWSAEVIREPLNLTTAKAAVRAYVESGRYAEDLDAVGRDIVLWLSARVERRAEGEKLAIVLDIDETVLSNYPQMDREDFGYNRADWVAWVDKAEAPAIPPMRRVYQEARRLGVAVVFLTGRSDPEEKPGTLTNLKREGMGDYLRIYFKTTNDTEPTAAERKLKRRAEVEAEGWTIIASAGDQESDFQGGHTERGFKLPNPFYAIP